GARRAISVEAAVQSLAEGGIGRAVILKRPAERLAVEGLVCGHVGRRQFEIVQLAVFAHGASPRKRTGTLARSATLRKSAHGSHVQGSPMIILSAGCASLASLMRRDVNG